MSRFPAARLAGVAALALLGFLLPRLLGGSAHVYDTLTTIAIFSAMSYGLDIILSDLGEISLAHTAFFATGAYAAAILVVNYGEIDRRDAQAIESGERRVFRDHPHRGAEPAAA